MHLSISEKQILLIKNFLVRNLLPPAYGVCPQGGPGPGAKSGGRSGSEVRGGEGLGGGVLGQAWSSARSSSEVWWGGGEIFLKKNSTLRGCGRYASCGHAGGLSCIISCQTHSRARSDWLSPERGRKMILPEGFSSRAISFSDPQGFNIIHNNHIMCIIC